MISIAFSSVHHNVIAQLTKNQLLLRNGLIHHIGTLLKNCTQCDLFNLGQILSFVQFPLLLNMPVIQWTPFVFIRYILFFIPGILFEIYFPLWTTHWEIVAGSTSVVYILLYSVLKRYQLFHFNSVFGILAGLFLFSAGALITQQRTDKYQPDHISNNSNQILAYKAIVKAEVERKTKSNKTEIEILEIKTSKGWQKASGRILLYTPLNSQSAKPNYEDILLIKGTPCPVPAPFNPEEFDYKKYLSYKQIHYQQFLKGGDFAIIDHHSSNQIISFSLLLRQKSDSIFRKYIPRKEEYAIATALVLGVKSALDNEIKQAYSSAGAMHILAVSGMHVVLVFQLLTFVIGRLRTQGKRGYLLFAIISLILIWLYAFVTGFSPSVLRAVVMFTFVMIGEILKRQKSIYNTLALSAFCLLGYDPFLIMDVGFQFSYLAVLGIIYFHPRLYPLLNFKNIIADTIWKNIIMSIAAQLTVFPLSLYYFHQFPTYFLFSNILLITLSELILYAGVALLSLSWIYNISYILGIITGWMIWLLNQIVFFIEDLPLSIISGIHISIFETILIYSIIIFILILFFKRKFKYIVFACILTLILAISQFEEAFVQSKQKRLVIYKVKNSSPLEFQNGTRSSLIDTKAIYIDKSIVNFSLLPNQIKYGITSRTYSDSFIKSKFQVQNLCGFQILIWQGKTMIFIDKPISPDFCLKDKLSVDLIILQSDATKTLKKVAELFEVNKIVVDASNNFSTTKKLVEEGKKFNISLHAVPIDGALVWDL